MLPLPSWQNELSTSAANAMDSLIIEAELRISIQNMNVDELSSLSQSTHANRDHFNVELYIFLSWTLFQKQKDVMHLDYAIRAAQEWYVCIEELHTDSGRRQSIIDTLIKAKLFAVFSGQVSPMSAQSQIPAELRGPSSAICWCFLGQHAWGAFQKEKSLENITAAAKAFQQAVINAAIDDVNRAEYFNQWAGSLLKRFEVAHIKNDLDYAIRSAEEAVEISRDRPRFRGMCLTTLGACVGTLYELSTDLHDLDRSIAIKEDSIIATAAGHPRRAMRLMNLSGSFGERFAKKHERDDLQRCVDIGMEALNLIPMDHPQHPNYVFTIVKRFITLFETTQEREDLDRLQKLLEGIIEGMPRDYPARSHVLGSLQHLLTTQEAITKGHAKLDSSILLGEQILQESNNDSPARAMSQLKLEENLETRYEETGALHDIDRAVVLTEQRLAQLRIDDDEWPECLSRLARRLGRRYESRNDVEDLKRSIIFAGESVSAIPNHKNRLTYLHIFGSSLIQYHLATASIPALNRAVTAYEQATNSTDTQDPRRQLHYMTFGSCLLQRYVITKALRDLNGAVVALEEAAKCLPADRSDLPGVLNGLGQAYFQRYRRIAKRDDLDRAISVVQEAVEITPTERPDRHIVLNSLGVYMSARYEQSHQIGDLDKAIESLEDATKAAPTASFYEASCVFNLADRLKQRHDACEADEDLDHAIKLYYKALEIVPTTHPARAGFLQRLVAALINRHSKIDSAHDWEALINAQKEAWACPNTPPANRITIGMQLARYYGSQSTWSEARKILVECIDLLPRVAPRFLKATDQQFALRDIAGLASMAAAMALNDGATAMEALQILENGRGIIAGLLMDKQSDISNLKSDHPQLEERLTSLWQQLDFTQTQDVVESIAAVPSWSEEEKLRRDAVKQLDMLFEEIRSKPGYERFLLPTTAENFADAAAKGPVIIINVSAGRCDAFLVTTDHVRVLELPSLSLDIAEQLASDHKNSARLQSEVLEKIWFYIAKPVLDALGYIQTPSDDNWPQVWWITTGPLTYLPIHAAGHGGSLSSDSVLNRVMSSYSSSLRMLVHRRGTKNLGLRKSVLEKAVLVGMSDTPSFGSKSTLPFASTEIDMLANLGASLGIQPVQPARKKEAVLNALKGCRIFHFAGHGLSDPFDPSQSCLLLDDWKDNPLTVASLREHSVVETMPFLAYLSACSTGVDSSSELADEGIHLASALQLSGFRHVIGTLWEVSDARCVAVAKSFYQTLIEKGASDSTVCLALHLAVRKARDSGDSMRRSKQTTGTRAITQPDPTASDGAWTDTPNDSADRPDRAVNDSEHDIIGSTASQITRDAKLKFKPAKAFDAEDPHIWASFIHYGV